MYLNEGGSRLSPEVRYGTLENYPQLQIMRHRDCYERYSMDQVFQNILHSDGAMFHHCLQFFAKLIFLKICT